MRENGKHGVCRKLERKRETIGRVGNAEEEQRHKNILMINELRIIMWQKLQKCTKF